MDTLQLLNGAAAVGDPSLILDFLTIAFQFLSLKRIFAVVQSC